MASESRRDGGPIGTHLLAEETLQDVEVVQGDHGRIVQPSEFKNGGQVTPFAVDWERIVDRACSGIDGQPNYRGPRAASCSRCARSYLSLIHI